MNTKPPSKQGLFALGGFVLVCFGLTLYMWLIFGGSAPLQPKSYRFFVPLPDAGSIARQADVRMAGVNVGKVINRTTDSHGDTQLEIEIMSKYAPLHRDTNAILRQKSVVGEAYVALSPGAPTSPILPDGGHIPLAQVSPTVRLDDVLRTFDPKTRQAFETWLTEQGSVFRGGGPALSAALAQLTPLATYGDDLLTILHSQDADLRSLIRDGGGALSAFTERRGDLRSLVRNSNTVFRVTAARNQALSDTFRQFPGFLRSVRTTVNNLSDFSNTATPLARQLQPVGRALTPVLEDSADLAPGLKRLLVGIGPLADASRTGLPAVPRITYATVPFLKRLKPYLGTLIPVFNYLDDYKRETAGAIANLTAATQATLPPACAPKPTTCNALSDAGVPLSLHYLRASLPINPESLSAYPQRLASSRSNPYPRPGSLLSMATGLPVFDAKTCVSHPEPTLSTSIPDAQRTELQNYYFTDDPNGPTCKAQAPLGSLVGSSDSYPTLKALP